MRKRWKRGKKRKEVAGRRRRRKYGGESKGK